MSAVLAAVVVLLSASPAAHAWPLSDQQAADRVARSGWEPRPGNAAATSRVPTDGELAAYRGARGRGWCNGGDLAVTGRFTGTTDEILQWGAHKWGLDPTLMRAVAAAESYWDHWTVGDRGESFGLTQVRTSHAGTYPLTQASAAFAVDYFGAALRHYVDGCAGWLNTVDRGQPYGPGDVWGAVGAWYSGRWHTPAAKHYMQGIQRHMFAQVWRDRWFPTHP